MPIIHTTITTFRCDVCGTEESFEGADTPDLPEGWKTPAAGAYELVCTTPRCLAHREALAQHAEARGRAKAEAAQAADRRRTESVTKALEAFDEQHTTPTLERS